MASKRLVFKISLMHTQNQEKSWFSKNWLWFIPTSGCLGIILLLLFGVGTVIFGTNKLFGEAGPYEYAFTMAKNNNEVITAIGNPIEKGDSVQFSFSFDNQSKNKADFKIPISGSKSEGEITVKAYKQNEKWVYSALYVEIKDSTIQINLLDKSLEGI